MQALAAAHEESRRAVDAAVERYAISAERVADAMARLAFTDLRQVVDVSTEIQSDGRRKVRDFADIDGDAHQAIAEIRQSPTGEVSVDLHAQLTPEQIDRRLAELVGKCPPLIEAGAETWADGGSDAQAGLQRSAERAAETS